MEENSLSIVSLIFNAGFVVQLVMIILVLMSIYSWTVIMSKKKILMDASNDIETFHEEFERNEKLSSLYKKLPSLASDWSAMEDIFGSGYKEFTHTKSTSNQSLIMNSERAYRSMNTSASNEIDRLDSSLSILAMIASSSPYIGLFGTVWGIMHSFIGLASVKQATIAVVAPGIAEALIATAFGLFAAIPATIAYNRLVSQVEDIGNRYTAFVEEIFVILQRQK
ncbi:MAG: protein TolQ [Porticoccaceae bacterium]|jgi:biopolymer transport protein TolQ|nr:protein TolQ [Porticoccaceae bacterium]|tara:strand:- start:1658 stop:2329 length:672 start_codon:yes stop_codon:yes gene_type:complete